MKHNIKIIAILLTMFLVSQLIGIFIIGIYSPQVSQVIDDEGNLLNVTSYNLPYGMEPPEGVSPAGTLISIAIAIAIAVVVILLLMKFKVELFLRLWFFAVVTLALAISLNAIFFKFQLPSAAIIAIAIALPLAFIKIFKRNIIVHNITELAIYPGIAAIFVPLLNIWTVVLLLILISIYDMYAVWKAGFMQKMAQYHIEKLRLFPGFFLPTLGKKQKAMMKDAKTSPSKAKKLKDKKIKVNVAILGGGDVVFPMILAGVVLNTLGLLPALIIVAGATAALATLFYYSKKGKSYPAMPFITIGSLIALGIAFLI
ncbi:hypothetical protein CMI47_04345 [Candidatus Pacearchaeota archaeon]|nr:hypothetical protein [Candidatus Pacearchaeota archaeon]|tara:strand:- start:1103 stop:2044 length:942 start_codon:yes stop_codon:yes gene_type:complete